MQERDLVMKISNRNFRVTCAFLASVMLGSAAASSQVAEKKSTQSGLEFPGDQFKKPPVIKDDVVDPKKIFPGDQFKPKKPMG